MAETVEGLGRWSKAGTLGSHTYQCKHACSQHGIHCVEPGHLWGGRTVGLGMADGAVGQRGKEEGSVQRMEDVGQTFLVGPSLTGPNPPQMFLRNARSPTGIPDSVCPGWVGEPQANSDPGGPGRERPT